MIIAMVAIIAAIVGGVGFGRYCESCWAALIGATIAGLIGGVATFGISMGYSNPRDVVCTVTDKDRAKTDGGSDMRVYTKECGVLKVQDLFWAREYDSADTFAAIAPGHRYRFHITGIRVGFWSVFPNIRSVQEVH